MARITAMLCIALVATGCYSPGYVDCEVTCGTSMLCPDGTKCLGGLCRVGGNTGQCGVPNSDGSTTDGDNLDGPIDGPPVTVGDEDNDGVPNATDICPISVNNNNMDGDGVGDACEHITGGPDDDITLFDGFDAIPGNALVVGPWTVSNGSAHIVSAPNRADSITFALLAPSNRRTTVLAKVRIDAKLNTADPTTAGVVVRTDGNAAGVGCGFGRDPSTSGDGLMLISMAAAADARINAVPLSAAPGTTNVVAASRNPSNEFFSCSILNNAAGGFPAIIPTAQGAGIRTRSISASFEWVMIIDSPN